MIYKLIFAIAAVLLGISGYLVSNKKPAPLGLPNARSEMNILPFQDDVYTLGTTTGRDYQWKSIHLGTGTSTIESGALSIGSSTPWAKLTVNASSTENIPLFALATTTPVSFATNTAMVVDVNGKVGIGTSTPGQQLSVAGALLVTGNGSASSTIQGGLSSVGFLSSNGVTVSGGAILIGGDAITDFVGTGLSVSSTGVLNAAAAATINSGTVPRFTYYSGATTLDSFNQFFIDTSAGSEKLGMGTTTPWGRLSVNIPASASFPAFAVGTTTPTSFATSTAFVIDQNGLIGIGTSTPGFQLSLAGSMYIAGDGRATTTTIRGLISQLTFPGDSKGTSTFASGLSASGLHSIDGLTVTSNSTNTFSGGLTVLGAGGFVTANGLTISAGGLRVNSESFSDLTGNALSRSAAGALDVVVTGDWTGTLDGFEASVFAQGTINSGTVNRMAYYSGATALSSFNQFTVITTAESEKVGIGTTTPWSRFSLQSPASVAFPLFSAASTTPVSFATNTPFMIDQNGNVYISNRNASSTSPFPLFIEGGAVSAAHQLTAASTVTLDFKKGNHFEITMTGETTFVFTNPWPGLTATLFLCQDSTGSRTAIWPASTTIQWTDGSASSAIPPSLTIRPGHCHSIYIGYRNATGTPKYFLSESGPW